MKMDIHQFSKRRYFELFLTLKSFVLVLFLFASDVISLFSPMPVSDYLEHFRKVTSPSILAFSPIYEAFW